MLWILLSLAHFIVSVFLYKLFVVTSVLSVLGSSLFGPRDCKYRELTFKTEITDFFTFCHERLFGELFSKVRLNLAREF